MYIVEIFEIKIVNNAATEYDRNIELVSFLILENLQEREVLTNILRLKSTSSKVARNTLRII